MKIAFLGAGKMATALAGGIITRHIADREDVIASDASQAAAQVFTATTGIRCTLDNAEALTGADVVFIAVKPQVAQAVIEALPEGTFSGSLVISIAAGIPIAKLETWTGTKRVIRVMPNTPALIGRGASGFAAGEGASNDDKETTRRLIGSVGVIHQVAEEKIDAVTGVSGSGPAYVFEFIQALIDAGVKQGLSSAVATDLVLETVVGAAQMARDGIDTPDNLRIAVTSPGGTTAAGLKVLKDNEFRSLINDVVQAAVDRSLELG